MAGGWLASRMRRIVFRMTPSARTSMTVESEAGTAALGAAVAAAIEPPAVIALCGTLGAGKTRFARALAVGLGADESQISSPTFVLLHEYEGRTPVYHFDAYRIVSEEEFWQLGAEEYLNPSGRGVTVIEWADRVARCLPAEWLNIEIFITGETSRRFVLSAHGERYARLLARLEWPNPGTSASRRR
jgi:tRNA threonylcarbamoyladenosine biosynthesis protein TsaE